MSQVPDWAGELGRTDLPVEIPADVQRQMAELARAVRSGECDLDAAADELTLFVARRRPDLARQLVAERVRHLEAGGGR